MTRRQKWVLGFCLAALLAGIGAFALKRSAAQSAATQPSVSPEVRALLDRVRQAYASLASLSDSGTLEGHLDIDGVHRNDHAQFAGLYSSAGLFRNETKEITGADSGSPQSTSDALLGNNGVNIYLFFPERNRYQLIDAPKGKVSLQALGDDVADILRNQNLSLALALSGDAESELLQDATSVARVEDVIINGQSCPAILILHPMFDQTLVIDPQTHLLRRTIDDVSKNARMQGAKEIKSALLTVDYAYSPSALSAAQFAWSPPPGSQELTPSDAASDLDGKPAPPFSLTDMDGNPVTAQGLKGSVYVLDFWATWCGPCVASLPQMDAMYKEFKGKGVKFFAVNVQEDKSTVAKYVADTKLGIPVLMDSDGKVSGAFDPDGMIPLTAVVGKDGKVIKAAHMGGVEDQLRPILTDALKP